MQTSLKTSGDAALAMLLAEANLSELIVRYQPGETYKRGPFYVGRPKNSTESGLLSAGQFVILSPSGSLAPATGDEGRASSWERCPAGRRPDGYLLMKDGELLVVRAMELGDVPISGIVEGYDYVVGTDYKPAKYGDSNYPSSVSNPWVVGVGFITGKLMLGMASRVGTGGLSGRNLTASTAVIADSRTDFDINVPNIDLSKLPVGGRLVISGMIDALTAAAATTFTFYLKAVTAGAAADVDIFLPLALDIIDAGDNVGYEVTLLKYSATQVMSWGRIGCKGDVTGKNNSGGGLKVATTLDMSVLITFQPACSFSVAGANSAIHRAMFVDPR